MPNGIFLYNIKSSSISNVYIIKKVTKYINNKNCPFPSNYFIMFKIN